MIQISKKEYEEHFEEMEILRNSEMTRSIRENNVAKKKCAKTWELRIY